MKAKNKASNITRIPSPPLPPPSRTIIEGKKPIPPKMKPTAIREGRSISEVNYPKTKIKMTREQDEYGLYKDAPNYHSCRADAIAWEKFKDREKLNKIPKWIRKLYNAI